MIFFTSYNTTKEKFETNGLLSKLDTTHKYMFAYFTLILLCFPGDALAECVGDKITGL